MLGRRAGAARTVSKTGPNPLPVTGNAYAAELPQIPGDWKSASMPSETRERGETHFRPEMVRNFILTKAQELAINMQVLTPQEQVEILSGHGVNRWLSLKIGIPPDRHSPDNMKTRLAIIGDMFRQTAGRHDFEFSDLVGVDGRLPRVGGSDGRRLALIYRIPKHGGLRRPRLDPTA